MAQPTSNPHSALPPQNAAAVYILEFASGLLKVGRTQNPQNRVAQHIKTADQRGDELLNKWVSPWHDASAAGVNEGHLIEFCKKITPALSGHHELFDGVDFEEAVEYAIELDFGGRMELTPQAAQEERATRQLDVPGADEMLSKLVRGLTPGSHTLIASPCESMAPTFGRFDTLVVDVTHDRFSCDAVFAFTSEGDTGIYVKRIQKLIGNGVKVISDNPLYEPYCLSPKHLEGISVIGRVIGKISGLENVH